MLDGLRVLDLTDECGLMCGRMLADLGADVVQVEPIGGSPARQAVPVDPDTGISFTWHAFTAGKRGIAVDLSSPGDLDRLRDLAARADVLVTSWSRADLEAWGLDEATVRRRSPRLIYTAISAFGWSGPKAEYAASDLVVWAAGGPLAPHVDGDRPPLRISVPQSYLHAAADAATGSLLALIERRCSGRGQFVDVSAQISVSQATLARVLAHAVDDENPEWQQQPTARADQSGSGAATPNSLKKWACADGLIELHLSMGPAAGAFTNRLFGWLREEGAVDERIAAWDWRQIPELVSGGEVTFDDLDEARSAVAAFMAGKTKAEVIEQAKTRRLLCMAIYDMADVSASPHLAARGFFEEIEIEGVAVDLPAAFARVEGASGPRVRGSAPKLGEHDADVARDWLSGPLATESGASPARRGPALDGVKVLDLSWVVAGPLIGRTLADFGAEVIRVESSVRVETARMMQPFHGGRPDREGSALFGNCNAGKLGATVDLASPDGQRIVRELAVWADVVIESFSPGRLARWGLDYASLRRVNPSLIMVSTSIAGQDGPWSDLAGFGNVGSSLSGFQNLVGWPDRLPMGPFGPYTDYLGPRTALVTLLAALSWRTPGGDGCYVDVAQVESGVYFLAPQVAHVEYDGTVAQRLGNADLADAPHGVYRAADADPERFVAITVRDEHQWRALTGVLGRPDLAERPELSAASARRMAAEELDAAVVAWTRERPAAQVESQMQAAGVPAHLAVTPEDYVADPQLRHRGHLVEFDHPLHGRTVVEGARVCLRDTPGWPRTRAPMLGEHTVRVLREILGYDDEHIDALDAKGVLR